MSSFVKKSLPSPARVCVRLKACREAKHMSLKDMARRTRISPKHLLAMESCRFDDIPFGAVYQKNFLKRCASALDLPAHTFLDQFIDEEIRHIEPAMPSGLAQKKRLGNLPMALRSIFFAISILALIGYLGFEIKESIDPPRLTLYSPPDGFITSAQSLMVRGESENEAEISINGEAITADNDGSFSEQMYLSPGINTIHISAKRKHGKIVQITRHVVLKEAPQVSYGR